MEDPFSAIIGPNPPWRLARITVLNYPSRAPRYPSPPATNGNDNWSKHTHLEAL